MCGPLRVATSAVPGRRLMTLTSTPDNPAPPGGIEEDISAADGVRLRTARWTPSSAIGTVVVLGGRAEFIEKYFEVIGELLARGFAVATMDWRGQGGSDRPLRDARKGHVDDFIQFECDLDALVEKILARECPRPWFGLCHSMGAAVLLGASEGGRCPFERLVLTSPMIAVKGVNHRGATSFLVAALDSLGMGGAFTPGAAGDSLWLSPFEGNVFTSDEGRFARDCETCRSDSRTEVGRADDSLDSRGFSPYEAPRRFQVHAGNIDAHAYCRGRRGSGDRHCRNRAVRFAPWRGPNCCDRWRTA